METSLIREIGCVVRTFLVFLQFGTIVNFVIVVGNHQGRLQSIETLTFVYKGYKTMKPVIQGQVTAKCLIPRTLQQFGNINFFSNSAIKVVQSSVVVRYLIISTEKFGFDGIADIINGTGVVFRANLELKDRHTFCVKLLF